MCQLAAVSRSGYYRHWQRSAPRQEETGLAQYDIQPSMSRVVILRQRQGRQLHETLKQEEINGSSYRNLRQARSAIGAFIETVYNRQRLHSALAYCSSDEYEAALARLSGAPSSPPEVSITESCY